MAGSVPRSEGRPRSPSLDDSKATERYGPSPVCPYSVLAALTVSTTPTMPATKASEKKQPPPLTVALNEKKRHEPSRRPMPAFSICFGPQPSSRLIRGGPVHGAWPGPPPTVSRPRRDWGGCRPVVHPRGVRVSDRWDGTSGVVMVGSEVMVGGVHVAAGVYGRSTGIV